LLFMLATSVHHRTHTFDLTAMGGLAQKTPVLAACFVAGTMASIGLPAFANFWGELTIFVALWKFSPGLTAVAVAGVAISAEVERHLFEPFFSTRSRGSGLGLYICRELCDRHGANIEFSPGPAGSRYSNVFAVVMRAGPAV